MALLGGLDGRDDFHGKGANTPARIASVNGLLRSIESIFNKNELAYNTLSKLGSILSKKSDQSLKVSQIYARYSRLRILWTSCYLDGFTLKITSSGVKGFHRAALGILGLGIGLSGCSTTAPPTLKQDRDAMATTLAISPDDLLYVARGEIASTETFEDYFTPNDTVILGLTSEELIWTHLRDPANPSGSPTQRISLSKVTMVSNDLDAVQVTVEDQVWLVRVRGWKRYELDRPRSAEFVGHLISKGALMAEPDKIYQRPIARRSGNDSLAADRKSSPSEVLADMNYEPPDQFAHKYGR